jgi:hypothetical protein
MLVGRLRGPQADGARRMTAVHEPRQRPSSLTAAHRWQEVSTDTVLSRSLAT